MKELYGEGLGAAMLAAVPVGKVPPVELAQLPP